MKTIGLTGGIACGKSTVAALLAEAGVPVIDADLVSREVVAPGSVGLAEIVASFGPAVLGPDGSLDRAALGRIVMADGAARQRLEAITHPRIAAAIGARLQALAAQGVPVAVVEAALMVETGSFRLYDGVLLVRCSPDVQLRRLSARQGWSEEQARRWISAQLSLDDKQARLEAAAAQGGPTLAVVDNDGDPPALRAATERAWGQLLAALLRR